MGAGYSSEEELEETSPERKSGVIVIDPKMSTPISDIHATVIRSSGDARGGERQEGDGMERPPEVAVHSPATAESKPDQGEKMIELPEAGLKLEKLPPIRDNVDLPPVVPESPLVAEKPKVYPKGSYPPTHRKSKEPRFVPYEPYKGAVASMDGKKAKRPPRQSSITSSPVVEKVMEKKQKEEEEDEDDEQSVKMRSELEQNYRCMLDVKEREINLLKEKLDQSDKQLKIQTKVNEEVKRLLVASVGEDIEARVDFLTQDKARLAADVVEYNNRIAVDWERKEELGVEKDVWRSKFLASTVIVEELSQAKQTVQQRVEELSHQARRLLLERAQLGQSLATTQLMVDKLCQAFDPLSVVRRGDRQNCLESVLSVQRSVEALSTRLVGERNLKLPDLPAVHLACDTPAEAQLKTLLAKPVRIDAKVPDQASSILAKDARPHLLKLGDIAQSPHQHGHSQFQTCSHCSGSVQNI